MRCKQHLSDLSSILGVCATCLREKLFALIEAQAHIQQAQEERRNSDANPGAWRLSRHGLTDQRFHGTPQVGQSGEVISRKEYTKKKKNSGFSLFYYMFRSKSGNLDSDSGSDPRASNSDDLCNTTPPSSSSSPSWFSTILAGRRGKKNRSLSLDEATIGVRRRTLRNFDRGMSPARYSDGESEEHYNGGSSGPSSQSSPAWKRTPASRPSMRSGGKAGLSRKASGMTFCLSPLVWSSPSRGWNQKGMPPDMVYPGEIRSPAKSRFHNATSFCKNRSRKLADFGRFRHNH